MVPVLTSDSFFKSHSEYTRTHGVKKQGFFWKSFSILTIKERRRFVVLSILDFVVNVIDILSIAFLLWMIHFYTHPLRETMVLPKWFVSQNSLTLLGWFVFLFSIKNLMAYSIAKAQNSFISEVAVRLSEGNLHKYQQARFNEFIAVDSSVQIRKIAYEPFEFCQYVLSGIQQVFTQSCLIALTVVAILFFNAQLFLLLVIILVPPAISIFYFVRKHLARQKQNIKVSNQQSLQYLIEALKGYVEGNIYNSNHFFLNRFVSYREKFSSYLFRSISLQTLPGRLVEIFAVIGLFSLVVISKLAGVADSKMFLTIGAFIASAYKIIPGIVKIVNISGQMKAHEPVVTDLAAADKNNTGEIMARPASIQSIEFSNISFNYGESPLINKLSFDLQKGDFLGIAGNSGKGKTTILHLLLGFLSSSGGNILINNEAIPDRELKNFWHRIAYVRQQCFFIHDTILKNITLDEKEFDEKRFQFAIEISGLKEMISSPEGVNKIIAENGKNISGGQQQRVALARALYKEADLILLDEPFNELDEASEFLLLHHLKRMTSNGKMIVMITHNKKALSFCDKIITLDE